jgi:hypothetical protein|nr:MAG TPA: hypothetical protein [Caudoviricetes sp.]
MKNINRVIDNISYDKIVKLLVALNWSQYHSLMNGKVLQYVSSDRCYAVLIPTVNTFDDYYSVMENTLGKIASYLNTSIESLINRILGYSYDIIKWRVSGDHTNSGTIPFFDMATTIDNIKNMLATSYIDVLNPGQFHKKVFTTEVNDNISKYSFGQSEFGSYIFNIMCPLVGFQYEMFDDSPENYPINRRINIHILDSINNIQNDISNGNKIKVDEDVSAGKYSVNFLDSLAAIYDNSLDSKVNISMDWCKALSMIKSNIPSDLELTPRIIEHVYEVADKYRPKTEEDVNKTFYGKIESISADSEIDKREYVGIRLIIIDDNNRKSTIQSKLNYQKFYSIVQNAFDNGLTVRLCGKLKSKGYIKRIEEGVISIPE